MIVDFNQLPDHARVWVYPASRELTAADQAKIITLTNRFLVTWMAHGQVLHAGCAVFHDRFLVIGVDESVNAASGCSIDASVRTVKEVEKLTGIIFSDRSQVPFLHDQTISLIPYGELKRALAAGQWSSTSTTFDPSVINKKELSEKWLTPAEKSWLRKYLATTQQT